MHSAHVAIYWWVCVVIAPVPFKMRLDVGGGDGVTIEAVTPVRRYQL